MYVDGCKVAKPGFATHKHCEIDIIDEYSRFVSRAALKLVHGLERSGYDPDDKICLDVGASTGGFTQILLEHGARQVFALDVGHDQLHPTLRNDPRVVDVSGLNARALEPCHIGELSPQFLVSDVSFISLKLALPRALPLAEKGAEGIFLIKPQFEVGRKYIGKGGIVSNNEVAKQTVDDIASWFEDAQAWHVDLVCDSPILGGDGNREYLMAARKPL